MKNRNSKSLLIIKWLTREITGVVMLAVILFLSAGNLEWIMGWILVLITSIWISSTAIILIPRNPDLLAERLGPKKGTKTWDTVILSIIGLSTISRCIIAGLDNRFNWTTGISLQLQLIMFLLAILGYTLVIWATKENAFFSQTVRIQKEKGHTVATGGPYRFIRHPGYIGVILFELSTPVMLGSWWALIPGIFGALLLILRTALEDKTLLKELDGYQKYTQQVHYRLIPGIW
jgi:protein-S-isoprenylcysteine O-methyltransferase Ste14